VTITENQQTLHLAETSAIAEWLSHHSQRLGAMDLDQAALADDYYWKNFAEASFMPNLALKQIFAQLSLRTPWPVRFILRGIQYAFNQGYLNPLLRQQIQVIHQHLTANTWIAGSQFTIADILLWFPLQACTHLDARYADYPASNRYLLRIQDRPAFQRAL
ncbi:glutathione binding-like protein, partial [Acinetobacter sp. NigerLNRRAM0016]